MERQSVTPSGTPSGRGGPTDDAAAERLYAEYSERLLAFCFRQLRSRAEAEDAVQITFLCALRALRRGVVPESESAWLHAIARNVCRWQQRTASRRPLSSDVEIDAVAVAVSANDEDTGRLSGLREALESLPERQRQALLLREWRGLSAHEIAEYLHLSPPATHALLTRARRSLAHALTAPQRAALGVASLVFELRSWLKAALGSVSAKAATVATVAVVGAGVGGVVVDKSVAGDRKPGRSVESTQPTPAASAGDRVGATSRTTAVGSSSGRPGAASAAGGGATRRTAATASARQPLSGPVQTIRGRARPGATVDPGSGPAPAPSPTPREHDLPVTDPLAGVGVDPPEPPALPPVELPPVDLPPVDLPPVDLPPIDLPTDVLPPIDVPSVDLPPVPPLPKLLLP
jgi:RNA polymerase sigma-70 factor (ECF subfamily)